MKYYVTDYELMQIADAIRSKTNSSASLSYPEGFINAISQIQGNTFLAMIEGTIGGYYENNRVSYVGDYALCRLSKLTSVRLSACRSIGYGAFTECYSLSFANFPACVSIANYAFSGCSMLTIADFPECTFIGGYAFLHCSNLQSINTSMCITVGNDAFHGCSALSTIMLPSCERIGPYAFYDCINLMSVYLMSSSYCQLTDTNTFSNTPILPNGLYGRFGTIFVPSSMINTYKTMTNWSYYSDRFIGV